MKYGLIWTVIGILTFASGSWANCTQKFALKREEKQFLPLAGIHYAPVHRPKVALVLSGGGARGIAHVGVLKALQQHHIPIDMVIGTSMGAVVGGFFSAGYPATQIEKIVKKIDWNNLFSDQGLREYQLVSQKNIPRRHILQFRLKGFLPIVPPALTQGQKVLQVIYEELLSANFRAESNFDQLPIPFRAVATDLLSGEMVVIKSGDLAEAMNASLAMPLLFAPVEKDGRWLVDGGIANNLPTDVALQMGADIVIAVDVTSPLRPRNNIRAPWEIADQVTTIMMADPTKNRRRLADVLIQPDLRGHTGADFTELDSLIQWGQQAAEQAIWDIKNLIREKTKQQLGPFYLLGKTAHLHFKGIPPEALQETENRLITQKGNFLYSHDVLVDLERLDASGYLQTITACIQGPFDTLSVRFQGEPFPVIHRVSILDNNLLPDTLKMRIQRSLSGKRLNIFLLKDLISRSEQWAYRHQLALFHIDTVIYRPRTHHLFLKFNPGILSAIQIVGNHHTRNWVILRDVPLTPGQPFRSDLAVLAIKNVYSSGLFHRVSGEVRRKGNQYIFVIKVKERESTVLRLGARASLERKSDAIGEILEDNLFGLGVKASLTGILGVLRREAYASFYTTRIFKTYLTYRLNLFYQERQDRFYYSVSLDDWEYYRTIRRGFHFTIGQLIQRLGLISAGIRIESVHITGPGSRFPFHEQFQVRSIVLRSILDKRDALPFPERGIYNRWFWESGDKSVLGASRAFTRFSFSLEGYFPISPRVNLHPFFQGGTGDLTVPFSEYFRLGGQENFPGLFENELYGRQFIHGGMEVRYMVPVQGIRLYHFLRYDIGGIWRRPDDRIQWADFQHSVSFSLAIKTLLGPIKFTLAHWYRNRTLAYFSVGYDF